MRKIHLITLGCKINQYESQALAESFQACGHSMAPAAGQADLVLVNSCAVTANAVSDLRQTVRRLHHDNPAAEIIITGCAAQVMAEELASLPGVTRVVPQKDKATLLCPAPQPAPFPPFSISDYGRARPVLKVQDGCSHRCTYCIVPLTRGRSVSREPGAVLAEAQRLLEAGFRELVVGGINLRQYGRDLPDALDFWDLLAMLERELAPAWADRARIRLSSLEPGQLNAKALDVLSASRLVCPHLHLSLQSGDPGVLARMGRGHYKAEQALSFTRQLAGIWPRFGLGADILVGFPGETDAEFASTYAMCRELPLSYAHVFPFSPRPGTAAATVPGQTDPHIRKERAARLRGLVSVKRRGFLKSLAGLDRIRVLAQDADGRGTEACYAPCRLISGRFRQREIVTAMPAGIEGGVILAKATEEP